MLKILQATVALMVVVLTFINWSYYIMSILNKNEVKVRESLLNTLAVTEFLLAGGRVTVCPTKKVRVSRKVSVKSKLVFGTAEPVNRPSNAWDVLLSA
jgi:hypothetical protein